eukprot:jgi/Astpho2/7374/Aster-01965
MASSTAEPLLKKKLSSDAIGRQQSIAVNDGDLRQKVIVVPKNFEVQEGVKLSKQYTVGKELAGGSQGAIFELQDSDGKDLPKLLKVLKMKFAAPITGADVGLKREWIIGQHLNTLGDDGDEMSGFMGTGEALVAGAADGVLEGLILEKLNGWEVKKRLEADKDFEDAEYILEMLRQVFTAIDKAETRLGFVHHDLRIQNIMEHRADAKPLLPKGFASKSQRRQVGLRASNEPNVFHLPGDQAPAKYHFKIIDYGHAALYGTRTKQRLPRIPFFEVMYRWALGKGDTWRLLHSMINALDGRTWHEAQASQVKVVRELIHEVTGIRINTFFLAWDQDVDGNGSPGNGQGSNSGEEAVKQPRRGRGKGKPWQRKGCRLHNVRKLIIRLKGFLFPRNTNFTAGQALQYIQAHAPPSRANSSNV